MNYDELERLKVEADRWIACVAGDGSTAANASQGIRSLFDKLNISLPEGTQWEPPADCVAWPLPKQTKVWVEVKIEELNATDKVPFWIAPGTLIAGHPNMLRMAGAVQPKPGCAPKERGPS